jgi:uncharacterized protein CbrC (UPF0167 family)
MSQPSFVFYSTPEYETKLKEKYEFEVKRKQDEIDQDQKRTGRIQKFTAKAHISKLERVFIVYEGKKYCEEILEENICPEQLVNGGNIYILDRNFELYIMEFLNRNKSYKVTFSPDGKYGPTVYYNSEIGATPARLEAHNDETLIIEDESKYDICVG